MADSRCCCGCSNVRKGAWVIAVFNIVTCVLFTFKTLTMLSWKLLPNNAFPKSQHSHNYKEDSSSYFNSDLDYDFKIFSYLFILFLFFYVNLNLKKATYMHNVQSINQWLVTHTIFFVFFIIFVGFVSLKYSLPDFISFGIPVSIVFIYQIYVVKNFYDDELKFLAISDRNTGTQQPALRGTSYVTITSQSVQSTAAYPVQPPAAYPVQSGAYIIQQPHQPVSQAPYPQQTYQPQQVQSQIHPGSEPYASQEYCNPPPYSPTYNPQESSSTKQ